jgi:hypothetical protein
LLNSSADDVLAVLQLLWLAELRCEEYAFMSLGMRNRHSLRHDLHANGFLDACR